MVNYPLTEVCLIMTDKFRKITAIAAATALCAMTAGCGEDTMYIGSAGGTDIPAGVYIYFLQNAYTQAK